MPGSKSMKSLLPRNFSRSLPALLPSSRSNHDHLPSLPDYYRNTRREVYGPYFSAETQSMHTMVLSLDSHDESRRSSFLLDIEPPEALGEFDTKTYSTDTLDTSSNPSLCLPSSFTESELIDTPPDFANCFKIGRALLQGFVSLVCSGRSRWKRKN